MESVFGKPVTIGTAGSMRLKQLFALLCAAVMGTRIGATAGMIKDIWD